MKLGRFKSAGAAALVFAVSTLTFGGSLSLEERAECQRRIDRVYRSLREPGAASAGNDARVAVLDARAASRAEETVRLSTALAQIWARPLEPQQLQAEIDRVVRATKRPAVLAEIFAALDDDPYLVAECLARPALVRRLARSWYAGDDRFHASVRAEAERALAGWSDAESMAAARGDSAPLAVALDGPDAPEWAESLLPRVARAFGRSENASAADLPLGPVSPLVEDAQRFAAYALRRTAAGGVEAVVASWPKRPFDEWWQDAAESFSTVLDRSAPFDFTLPDLDVLGACVADTWEPTAADVPDPRDYPRAVWTGAEMIIWGGDIYPVIVGNGARYDPATDTWSPTSTVGAPADRYLHTAVWTGSEMIVWGGITSDVWTNSGARYDPDTDTWAPTSVGANVPLPRAEHTAVWTGSEMIVWGGSAYPLIFNDGARYNPSTDTWNPVAATTLSPRYTHTAVWTGTEMIVWGGEDYPTLFGNGARYNPGTNSWTALPATGAPVPRIHHTAVWTGSQMIVWGGGGESVTFLQNGARFSPGTNSWSAVTLASAPGGRYDHTAVWTGSEMIVWGGLVGIGLRGNTGGRYNPATNTWTATSTAAGTPQRRMRHCAVWTGSEMIVWGGNDYGFDGFLYLQSGGRYSPATNSWVATAAGATVPEARRYSSLVWTGAEMIVWGGFGSQILRTGGRYDPALDDWTPTATLDAPTARILHSAVWSGTEMIVWGGGNPFSALATGGRYDPTLDDWSATATVGAPAGRMSHTAVWTGTRMIVAGMDPSVGRYDPVSNAWETTSAPPVAGADRTEHVATWTGDEMLLWGGRSETVGHPARDGGRYDPRWDSWLLLRAPEGPHATLEGTAAWADGEWLVWGGVDELGAFSEAGSRFDPETGAWAPISGGPDDPSPRRFPTAVWTGEELVVWGGLSPYPSKPLADGSRYDPLADAWSPVSGADAPQERQRHGAVFTDQPDPRMIVWGGLPNASSGGAYCTPCVTKTWYRDADADNDGDAAQTTLACTRPLGYAATGDDCDDADGDRFPANPERCDDLKDNDCNGVADDAAPPGPVLELYVAPSGPAGIDFDWPHAAAADSYDLTRGSVVALVASGGDFTLAADACLANDQSLRSDADPDLPPAGDAFWYVIRAVNCAGNGTYDSGGSGQQGSRDPGLAAAPNACP